MSDPVSKAEIEDVLSSIRRLVSEDVTPPAPSPDREIPLEQTESITGKFVLTPAFRVSLDTENEAKTRDETASEAEPFRLEQQRPDNTEISPESASGKMPDNSATGEVSDAPVQATEDDSDAAVFKHQPEQDAESPDVSEGDVGQPGATDATDLNFSELAGAPISAFEKALSPEDVPEFRALEDRVAHMEAAVSAQNLDWEPDGSEVDEETPDKFPGKYAFSSSRSDGDDQSNEPQAGSGPAVSAAEEEWKSDLIAQNNSSVTFLHKRSSEVAGAGEGGFSEEVANRSSEKNTEADEDVEAKLQELADTLGADADGTAGATEGEAPVFFRADTGAENADEEAVAETAPESATEGFEFVRNSFREPAAESLDEVISAPDAALAPEAAESGDDLLLDEASLRNLIGDVVREELKGDFGERITRNVRKMVRREIMRALAAREAD